MPLNGKHRVLFFTAKKVTIEDILNGDVINFSGLFMILMLKSLVKCLSIYISSYFDFH